MREKFRKEKRVRLYSQQVGVWIKHLERGRNSISRRGRNYNSKRKYLFSTTENRNEAHLYRESEAAWMQEEFKHWILTEEVE